MAARWPDAHDGVTLQDRELLRAKIGLVPQTAVLFSGTVSENIRFGAEAASDEEVRHAAEIAQASDDPEDPRERFYLVDMFPYPSGDLHMGHAEAYAIGDALARYWNMSTR